MVDLISDVLFLDGAQLSKHDANEDSTELNHRASQQVQQEDVSPEVLILMLEELGTITEILIVGG